MHVGCRVAPGRCHGFRHVAADEFRPVVRQQIGAREGVSPDDIPADGNHDVCRSLSAQFAQDGLLTRQPAVLLNPLLNRSALEGSSV